ncbi:MAG: S8 family serine peptidase [Bacteroidota bacterium]
MNFLTIMRFRNLFNLNIWPLLLVYFLLPSGILQSQTHKYWIFLKDKDPDRSSFIARKYSLNPEDLSVLGLTERAIERRLKTHPDGAVIDVTDIPLHTPYLAALRQLGIRTLRRSKWLNAVSAELSREQINDVLHLPFVQEVRPVAAFLRKEPVVQKSTPQVLTREATAHVFDYGPSLTQLELIRIPELHDMGITGAGVLIGMLDTGFRWKDHEALMNIKVTAEHDFINNDSVTANEGTQDRSDQDSHGTRTLSLVGGFKEGQLVGGAFGADFLLGKTEYVPTETKIEEDYWVAGIEWMEGQGVDVVNSSLGYFDFDPDGPGGPDYAFADLDGQTAVTTQAANIAASKGVVVVVSAGNNNGDKYWPWINTPADAPGVLAVGAVSASGTIAGFSSRGPTADGRTKPEVVTMGVGTRAASFSEDSSTYNSFFTGTSASAPLATCAAALLLSARPELTPTQVFDALRNTADRAGNPDNTFGWGLVNAAGALQYPTLKVDNLINNIEIFLASASGIVQGSPTLYFARGDEPSFTALSMELSRPYRNTTRGVYSANIQPEQEGNVLRFYIEASDSALGTFTIPSLAPVLTFSFVEGETILFPPYKKAVLIPVTFKLYQNYPNPFNQGTVIRYDLPEPRVVSLEVYSVVGQLVGRLVDGLEQAAGEYQIRFSNLSLASGVYFYALRAGEFTDVKKMILIK